MITGDQPREKNLDWASTQMSISVPTLALVLKLILPSVGLLYLFYTGEITVLYLKESLHIILMGTFLFEIITLYSIKARLMVVRKELF